MFCPKCGKPMPEGATTCPACTPITTPVNPAAPAANAPLTPDGRPYSRFTYFFKAAAQNFKIMNFVALGLGLLCVLLLIISSSKSINGSMFKIPFVSWTMGVAGGSADEIDEMCEALEEALTDEDLLEDFEDEYGVDFDDIKDEFGVDPDEYLDLISPPSLKNASRLAAMGTGLGMSSSDLGILNTLINVIRVWCVVLVFFTSLAIIFGKTWLTVLSYIFSISFLILFGGFVVFLLASAAYIAMAVLFSKLKFEYKFYLRNLGL